MCRSIVSLRRSDGIAETDEIEAAALQFVRKISGYRKPSQRNEAAFLQAVNDIAAASNRMLLAIDEAGGGTGNRVSVLPHHHSSTAPHEMAPLTAIRSIGRDSRS